MSAISKEDVKHLANELNKLINTQKKYQKEKENYISSDWYNDGSGRELIEDIDYLSEIVASALDTIIENKVKEMMNVT